MVYTLRIDETSPKGQSIIEMLKALAIDSSFLEIAEVKKTVSLTSPQEKELDSRMEFVLKNPTLGKSWSEVAQNLSAK